jgi:hypothetical protein
VAEWREVVWWVESGEWRVESVILRELQATEGSRAYE